KRSKLRPARIYAVDAAHVGAGADVELFQAIGRNPARVLDDETIHVHHPERAVGAGADLHGTEPVVGAGQEFASFFVGGAMRGESDAVGLEHTASDQVVHRLANKGIAIVVGTQEVVAVNARAAGAGDTVGGGRIVEPFERAADGEELIRIGT